MKKFFLSMLLAVSFLGFTATASNAWHFEVTYQGNGYFDSGEQYFQLGDWMMADAGARWYASPSDDPDGGVHVDYDIYSGWGDNYNSSGRVEFRIVSDFGNPNPQPVDVWFSGASDAYDWVDQMGNPMGLDVHAIADVWVDSDFGFHLDSLGYFDGIIELESNTGYSINTEIWLEAWAMADQPGPDHFESWDDYNNYFFDGEWGEIWAESNGDFGFSAEIQTAEVPIPGALFLLGSGLIGLVGIGRKFRS